MEGEMIESGTDFATEKLKDNWFSLVPNPDDPEDVPLVFKSLRSVFVPCYS